MAIEVKKGDADTFTEVITGLSSLAGYTAKMYIYNSIGTLLLTITGSISSLTITYELVNESSKILPIAVHRYETKIYDASDHVYTPSASDFIVKPADNTDPS